jgi:hypothetical protein
MFSNASASDKLSALSYLMMNLSGGNGTAALNSLFGNSSDDFFGSRFQSDSGSSLSSLSDTSSVSSQLDSLSALLGNSGTSTESVTDSAQNGILNGLSGLTSGNMSSQQYANLLQILLARMQMSSGQSLASDLSGALSSDSSSL